MSARSFSLWTLALLWSPLLYLGPAAYWSETPLLQGFRFGWLCLLPLPGILLGHLWGVALAWRHHPRPMLLPDYQSLEVLSRLQRSGQAATLLLPTIGWFGLSLLLPHSLQQALRPPTSNLSLLSPTRAVLDAFSDLSALAAALLLLGTCSLSLLTLLLTRRRWLSLLLLVLWLLAFYLFAPQVWAQLWLWTPSNKGTWRGVLPTLMLWLTGAWGFHWLSPTRSTRKNLLLSLGLLNACWVSTLPFHQALLQHALPRTLLFLLLGALSLLALRSLAVLKVALKIPSFQIFPGFGAYLFGATLPLALALAWVGWLLFGGAHFGHPLQQTIWPMTLLLLSHIAGFVGHSLLASLHTSALQPPSRWWQLLRPLLFYLVLLLLLGLPGIAILKGGR